MTQSQRFVLLAKALHGLGEHHLHCTNHQIGGHGDSGALRRHRRK